MPDKGIVILPLSQVLAVVLEPTLVSPTVSETPPTVPVQGPAQIPGTPLLEAPVATESVLPPDTSNPQSFRDWFWAHFGLPADHTSIPNTAETATPSDIPDMPSEDQSTL
jgi:hypothetical protein